MNKDQRAFLIGCVIGDGHLRVRGSSATMSITHCAKQKEYLEWKVEKLSDILENRRTSVIRKINNSGYEGYSWEKGHKYLRILHKWMYKSGVKTLNPQILHYLNPEAIAIWYMDDGSLSFKKRDGEIHAREITLNTYLSKEENQIIIDYFFNYWGITFKIVKSKNSYRLRCGGREGWKLIKLIKPYIIPCMEYKIDMKYKAGNKIAKEFEEYTKLNVTASNTQNG